MEEGGPSDFLVTFHKIMIYGEIAMLIVAFLIWLFHQIKVSSIKNYKAKYDFIRKNEIQNYKYAFIVVAVGVAMFINTYGKDTLTLATVWFFVRSLIAVACGTIVGYIGTLMLKYYYTTKTDRKLKIWRYTPRGNPQSDNAVCAGHELLGYDIFQHLYGGCSSDLVDQCAHDTRARTITNNAYHARPVVTCFARQAIVAFRRHIERRSHRMQSFNVLVRLRADEFGNAAVDQASTRCTCVSRVQRGRIAVADSGSDSALRPGRTSSFSQLTSRDDQRGPRRKVQRCVEACQTTSDDDRAPSPDGAHHDA